MFSSSCILLTRHSNGNEKPFATAINALTSLCHAFMHFASMDLLLTSALYERHLHGSFAYSASCFVKCNTPTNTNRIHAVTFVNVLVASAGNIGRYLHYATHKPSGKGILSCHGSFVFDIIVTILLILISQNDLFHTKLKSTLKCSFPIIGSNLLHVSSLP